MKRILLVLSLLVLGFAACAILGLLPQVQATTYASDTFESFATGWTTANGNNATIAKSSTQAHGGSNSVFINSTESTGYAYAYKTFTAISGNHHTQMFLYIHSSYTTADNGSQIAGLHDGSNYAYQVVLTYHSPNYQLTVGDPTGTHSNICTLSAGSWQQIDIYYVSASGWIHVYLNTVKQGGDWTTGVRASTSPTRVYIGDLSSLASYPYAGAMYLDDMTIDDTAEDTAGPTAGSTGSTGTGAGRSVICYVSWSDTSGVSGFIFGTNNTGSWVNETWSSSSQWGNKTVTLNLTVGLVVGWQEWANDSVNNWAATSIQTITTTIGITINGCQAVDLDASNTTIYAGYKYYSFSVNVSDSNGISDLQYVDLRFEALSDLYTLPDSWVRWCEDNASFYPVVNTGYVVLSGSSNATSGNQAQLTFKIMYSWSYWMTTGMDAKVYAIDSVNASLLSSVYSLNMTLVKTVSVSTPTLSTTRTNPGGSLTMTGNFTYAGSSVLLPNATFVASGIQIHNNSKTFAVGSVNPYSFTFNIQTSLGSDTYHVSYDGADGGFPDGEKNAASPVIRDKVNITLSAADSRINAGSLGVINVVAIYSYDSVALNGSVTFNDTLTKSAVGLYYFNVSSISDLNYGLTTFTGNTASLIFDKVNVTSLSANDTRLNVNASISWTAVGAFEYDGASWSGTFTLNDTDVSKSVEGSYGFTVVSITDPSYGITAFDSSASAVIWDSLKIVSLQPVVYLGNGTYQYEAQIQHGSDNSTINNATVYVSGLNLTLTSNSSGWVSFVLGQGNITATGTLSIYGGTDNSFDITISAQNQTFLIAAWTLSAEDIEANTLVNVTIAVSGNSTDVWSGNAGVLFVPGDAFNVSVTWLANLELNTTSNVNIAGNATTAFNCTAYPFVLDSVVYQAASNATIASKTFASRVLTLEFSGGTADYVLVTNYGSQPKYVLNMTYDMATAFASGYLVLSHYGNQTLTLGYEVWGNTYVKMTDQTLTAASLSGQRLDITATGSTGVIGQLNVYCGSRGNPATVSGFTATSYAGSILSGTYVFASDVTLMLDWTSSGIGYIGGGPGGTGGDGLPYSGALTIVVDLLFPQPLHPGSVVNGTLTLNWTGSPVIYIWDIWCATPYEDWIASVPGAPVELKMDFNEGYAQVEVFLTVPYDVEVGKQYIPCVVTIATSQGSTKTVQSIIELQLTNPSAEVPSIMTYLFLIPFGGIIFFAFFRKSRHKNTE